MMSNINSTKRQSVENEKSVIKTKKKELKKTKTQKKELKTPK